MTDAEAIVGFVRAASRLEPDLARWCAATIWAGLGAASRRRAVRDDLLRRAARLLPPVSAWQKAHALAEMVAHSRARPGTGSAEGLVALAKSIYSSPGLRHHDLSASQIFRVLTRRFSRISAPAMEVGGARDWIHTPHLEGINE